MKLAPMTSNNPHTHIFSSQAIKVLFFVLALIVAFLFALNGRYAMVSADEFFDKWTKTIIAIDRYEVIEQK